MNIHRSQYVYATQPAILPSFSQLVDTLGQPPRPIPQEPRLSFDNLYAQPPGPPTKFPLSSPRTSEGRHSPPSLIATVRGEHKRQSVPHISSNFFLCDAPSIHEASNVVNAGKRPLSQAEPADNARADLVKPRPAKRQRKDRNQPMNPHYTRDGNLRKRLAQACERCRAQKIKCRLRGAACVLCIKQGLECKFAPRSYQSRTHERVTSPTSPRSQTSLQIEDEGQLPSCHSQRQQSGNENTEDGQDSNMASSPSYTDSPGEHGMSAQLYESRTPSKSLDRDLSQHTRVLLATDDLSIEIDPYLFDAALTKRYVDEYFTSVNQSPYYMLPRASTLAWISAQEKFPTQKILLYAIMAAGAMFSSHRHHETHCRLFTRIAQDGLRSCNSWFELPAIHALLILSTVSAHAGNLRRARDDSVAAIRCAYGLQLNEERTYAGDHAEALYLTSGQVAECCRRTFWLAYAKSTVWGSFFEGVSNSTMLQGSLKMPCNDAAYESGDIPATPQISLSSPSSHHQALEDAAGRLPSQMSLLIEAVAIMRDLGHHESSSSSEHTGHHHRTQPSPESSLTHAVRIWRRRLDELHLSSRAPTPPCLQVLDKYLYLLHHRYIPHLTPRYTQAHASATQLLEHLHHAPTPTTSSDPLLGCAIVLAFDTLTASGLLTSVLDRRETSNSGRPTFMALATRAVATMSELAEHSRLAATQLGAMKKRLAAIMAQSNTAGAWSKRGFYFASPLCASMRRKHDGVYDLDRGPVAGALGLGSDKGCEMLEMVVPLEEGR